MTLPNALQDRHAGTWLRLHLGHSYWASIGAGRLTHLRRSQKKHFCPYLSYLQPSCFAQAYPLAPLLFRKRTRARGAQTKEEEKQGLLQHRMANAHGVSPWASVGCRPVPWAPSHWAIGVWILAQALWRGLWPWSPAPGGGPAPGSALGPLGRCAHRPPGP